MRSWAVERRKRTRHLIELGGLVVKAGVVELTGDDRALIFGALLWMAEKLKNSRAKKARKRWSRLIMTARNYTRNYTTLTDAILSRCLPV
jgi:hypothetical protein